MQFYRMVKKYLPEKMTAEQQLEGKKGANQPEIWRRVF